MRTELEFFFFCEGHKTRVHLKAQSFNKFDHLHHNNHHHDCRTNRRPNAFKCVNAWNHIDFRDYDDQERHFNSEEVCINSCKLTLPRIMYQQTVLYKKDPDSCQYYLMTQANYTCMFCAETFLWCHTLMINSQIDEKL